MKVVIGLVHCQVPLSQAQELLVAAAMIPQPQHARDHPQDFEEEIPGFVALKTVDWRFQMISGIVIQSAAFVGPQCYLLRSMGQAQVELRLLAMVPVGPEVSVTVLHPVRCTLIQGFCQSSAAGPLSQDGLKADGVLWVGRGPKKVPSLVQSSSP
jgi:hypothetical protein